MVVQGARLRVVLTPNKPVVEPGAGVAALAPTKGVPTTTKAAATPAIFELARIAINEGRAGRLGYRTES